MFVFQNFNSFNIPQISTTVKSGVFQSSSFSSVKKVPDPGVVGSELSHLVELLKGLKSEKVLYALPGLKCETSIKNFETFSFEKLSFKWASRKKKSTSDFYVEFKEPITCTAAGSSAGKSNETINSENSKIFQNKSCNNNNINNDFNVEVKLKADDDCMMEEPKKATSATSQFNSSKSCLSNCFFKNGFLFINPGNGIQIGMNQRLLSQGQRRGFKTQRRQQAEAEANLLLRLVSGFRARKETTDPSQTVLKGKEFEVKTGQALEGTPAAAPTHLQRISTISDVILKLLKLSLLIGIIFFYVYLMATKSISFGQRLDPVNVDVTFSDARGVDEAKEELRYVVEFLRDPSRFASLGGKLPAGILIEGPPGTGKTLLARAVAGEAKVPFFHVCASEFDEYLVGEGARRVRNLFKTAREKSPAVIFIDEIDAVGGQRVSTSIHPYANQTINQLLAEMDGFVKNEGIIVIGATNRESDLDQALLRPGRFDLKIRLDKPDIKGRKEILHLYLSKIISKDVDVDNLAKRTIGLSGADLEAIVNQAALRAAVTGCEYVTTHHLDYALEKVTLGPEIRSKVIDEETNLRTAYHESGHALVAFFTKGSNMPVKVTIIPRGRSLGHTTLLPEVDRPSLTKSELLALIDVKMGGRAAEELIFGSEQVSTGCSSDLDDASLCAKEMVQSCGMSDKIGLRTHTKKTHKELGNAVREEIDTEIKKVLQESYERAKHILKVHAKEHKLLAETLLQKETLGADEINAILSKGKTE